MPDLILSADTQQYKDLAAEFAENEIATQAARLDQSPEFPQQIVAKAFELGLLNGRLPDSLGGLGLSLFDACVIAEQIGQGCAGIGAAFWGNDLGVAPLLVAGRDKQKERWLKPLLGQFSLAAACFAQPEVEYDRSGSSFTLRGQAAVINARHGKFFCLPAREPETNKSTAFVVDLETPGIAIGEPLRSIGLRAADLHYVKLSNVQLSTDHIIGTEYGAEDVFQSAAIVSLSIFASYAAGISAAALRHAVRYAQERQTMGTAIANHQAVAFMLADMARHLEASRFLIRKAAWLADHDRGSLASAVMAKSYALETTMQTAIDAVQVFGGYGYSKEYPVEKLMRDAKMMQLFKHPLVCETAVVSESVTACS